MDQADTLILQHIGFMIDIGPIINIADILFGTHFKNEREILPIMPEFISHHNQCKM